MTRLSITLASVALTLAFAPTAQAYSTEPAPDMLHQIIQGAPQAPQAEAVSGTCNFEDDVDLAALLGLPVALGSESKRNVQTAMACAGG